MNAINDGIDDKLFNHISESIKHTPYYNLLGIDLQIVAPGYAEVKATASSQHTNPIGLVHGGLVMSLADAAMGNAIRSLGVKGVTVDCSTSFIMAAPLGAVVIAKGKVMKKGKNLLFAQAQVYADDVLLADSKGTFYKTGDLHF